MINVSLHGIIFQLICIKKGVRESRAYLFAFYSEKKTLLRMNYVKRLTCRLICILHWLHVCAGAPQVTLTWILISHGHTDTVCLIHPTFIIFVMVSWPEMFNFNYFLYRHHWWYVSALLAVSKIVLWMMKQMT